MRNPADCSDCHDKPNEKLVPTEKEAFHGQCMGCHEKQGKGPWRADEEVRECGQCHLPEK
jgi:formate-dependent nitrite reductase cytochrome c552 subunit